MNKKIGLFLDDERNPEDVTWITYPDNIEWYCLTRMNDFMFCIMESDDIDYISFDHDLQDFDLYGGENTGYDCLKWLLNYCIDNNKNIPMCFFHSQNVVGKENMQSYYNNFIKFIEGE